MLQCNLKINVILCFILSSRTEKRKNSFASKCKDTGNGLLMLHRLTSPKVRIQLFCYLHIRQMYIIFSNKSKNKYVKLYTDLWLTKTRTNLKHKKTVFEKYYIPNFNLISNKNRCPYQSWKQHFFYKYLNTKPNMKYMISFDITTIQLLSHTKIV